MRWCKLSARSTQLAPCIRGIRIRASLRARWGYFRLTLFSGKFARILAGMTLQTSLSMFRTSSEDDVTVVSSAGRDIIPYNANSVSPGGSCVNWHILASGQDTLPGDIQISGLARSRSCGAQSRSWHRPARTPMAPEPASAASAHARNPYLPFGGARLVIGAGIGSANGLENSKLDFETFISEFVEGDNGARYLGELASLLGETSTLADKLTPEDFSTLPTETRDQLALDLFYLVLRDAGRDHNVEGKSRLRQLRRRLLPPSTRSWQKSLEGRPQFPRPRHSHEERRRHRHLRAGRRSPACELHAQRERSPLRHRHRVRRQHQHLHQRQCRSLVSAVSSRCATATR